MTRPPRPWFRFYVEAMSDRKLRRLKPSQRWLWVAVLAAARESPTPGVLLNGVGADPMTVTDLADYAGVSAREVRATLPLFELPQANMLGRDETTGAWRVINFGRRQYESDISTNRTRKHRAKEQDRNVPNTVPDPFAGTAQERPSERVPSRALTTETETEPDLPTQPTNVGTRPDPAGWPGSDPPPPPAPQDTNALLTETASLLATAETDRRQARGELDNPDGYRRSRITPIRREHEPYWRQLVAQDPTLTAQQLADAVTEPGPQPATNGAHSHPLDEAQIAARKRQEAGTAHLRALAAEPPDPGAASRIADLRNHLRPPPEPA